MKGKKVAKGKIVQKMAPEEQAILSNIASLISQLMQSSPEVPMMEEASVMEAEAAVPEFNEEDKDKMVDKGLEQTPSEGATASDDTEERIDDPVPEPSAENVQEIAKAILSMIKRPVVQKSASGVNPQITQILSEVVKIQKSNQDQLSAIQTAFGHILKGLGIADQLEVAKSKNEQEQKVAKSVDLTNKQLLDFINASLQNVQKSGSEEKVQKSNAQVVHDNLSDRNVLGAILRPTPGARTL